MFPLLSPTSAFRFREQRLTKTEPQQFSNCNSSQSQSHSYITTGGYSGRLPLFQAPIWRPRPDFCYYHIVAGLLMRSVLSAKRTGLSCIIAPGPRQRIHSLVLVPRYSWPYLTISDCRLSEPGGSDPRTYNPRNRVAQL
jgi:hypothetical protein